MRYPIWSAGSNPAVDPPLLKKKSHYIEDLISTGRAFWRDKAKPALGVIMTGRYQMQPRESVANGGTFGEAWAVRPSIEPNGVVIGVWQLKTR